MTNYLHTGRYLSAYLTNLINNSQQRNYLIQTLHRSDNFQIHLFSHRGRYLIRKGVCRFSEFPPLTPKQRAHGLSFTESFSSFRTRTLRQKTTVSVEREKDGEKWRDREREREREREKRTGTRIYMKAPPCNYL